jgi:hypothetical protein
MDIYVQHEMMPGHDAANAPAEPRPQAGTMPEVEDKENGARPRRKHAYSDHVCIMSSLCATHRPPRSPPTPRPRRRAVAPASTPAGFNPHTGGAADDKRKQVFTRSILADVTYRFPADEAALDGIGLPAAASFQKAGQPAANHAALQHTAAAGRLRRMR